ncbi:MAG: LysR substrate-binding domain-containing protein [Gammaproteobacteria bacterium]
MNLDLNLVRTFDTVVSAGGFTRAAERLHRTQSTISAQIRKLEEVVGQPLLERDTRKLKLTPHGEIVLEQGRRLLRLNDELLSRMSEPEVEGTVRLGTPEDFATSHLPQVLSAFRRAHPRVRLEVTCELTRVLTRQFRAGEHDLVLLKRDPEGASFGTRVWREPLVWVSAPLAEPFEGGEVSLVASPQPCVYRERAIAALEGAGRDWRLVYQSTSLSGNLAAVKAGLGLTILPRDMVPPGYHVLGEADGMPDLPDTEIALRIRGRHPSKPARVLYEHIVQALEAT